jgi:NAD(P)-dependent dehydrogenase (short-subunit alcohol dehydrogenase family)
MARVLITGSADGLGLLAARQLLDDGHDVTLHARDDRRAGDTRRAEPRAGTVVDGLEQVFAINVLAPYLLTALITPPARLVYLSSGVHVSGTANVDDPQWTSRRWSGAQAYRDSKLYDVLLAFAVARRWPGVRSNAVDPGWVPTRMGGAGAPDDLSAGAATQAWLAVSDDPDADVTGRYLHHRRDTAPLPIAKRAGLQDALLDYCAELTGTPLPETPLPSA